MRSSRSSIERARCSRTSAMRDTELVSCNHKRRASAGRAKHRTNAVIRRGPSTRTSRPRFGAEDLAEDVATILVFGLLLRHPLSLVPASARAAAASARRLQSRRQLARRRRSAPSAVQLGQAALQEGSERLRRVVRDAQRGFARVRCPSSGDAGDRVGGLVDVPRALRGSSRAKETKVAKVDRIRARSVAGSAAPSAD